VSNTWKFFEKLDNKKIKPETRHTNLRPPSKNFGEKISKKTSKD
jgi:hypothetical protein